MAQVRLLNVAGIRVLMLQVGRRPVRLKRVPRDKLYSAFRLMLALSEATGCKVWIEDSADTREWLSWRSEMCDAGQG